MFFFFKQKTAYEMRISDWSSDVCSSDLERPSMRAYQRTTLVEHTEERVIATLAARDGKEPDDLSIRAMVAAVTACFDISLRHWTERGAEGRFDAVFVEALAGCAAALPEGRQVGRASRRERGGQYGDVSG